MLPDPHGASVEFAYYGTEDCWCACPLKSAAGQHSCHSQNCAPTPPVAQDPIGLNVCWSFAQHQPVTYFLLSALQCQNVCVCLGNTVRCLVSSLDGQHALSIKVQKSSDLAYCSVWIAPCRDIRVCCGKGTLRLGYTPHRLCG